jgi:hypothetical protein
MGALNDYQRPSLTALSAIDLPCLPDRHGNGVLFRHPDLAQMIHRSQPFDTSTIDSSEGPAKGLAHNPLFVALQKNPEGFFGCTPEGRMRTADAIWKELAQAYKPWVLESEAYTLASQTLMAFDGLDPCTMHPKLRLFVAVVLMVAMSGSGKPIQPQDLTPWVSDPESLGLDSHHPLFLQLKESFPVFRAVLLNARAMNQSPELMDPPAHRRRARP